MLCLRACLGSCTRHCTHGREGSYLESNRAVTRRAATTSRAESGWEFKIVQCFSAELLRL